MHPFSKSDVTRIKRVQHIPTRRIPPFPFLDFLKNVTEFFRALRKVSHDKQVLKNLCFKAIHIATYHIEIPPLPLNNNSILCHLTSKSVPQRFMFFINFKAVKFPYMIYSNFFSHAKFMLLIFCRCMFILHGFLCYFVSFPIFIYCRVLS